MRWKDVNLNPSTRMLREFGGILVLLFLALGLREQFSHHRITIATGFYVLAALSAAVALIQPQWLKAVFVTSVIVTFPIGWVVSQLILFLLFFGLMTPMALVFRWRGRDPLHLKPLSEDDVSFWAPKTVDPDKRSYFKQF